MSSTDWNELDGYEALVSELRATAPAAPESLRQRVLDGAPAPRRRMSKRRRLALVVLPVAVVLAVGAAFVHGFVSSGSRNHATALEAALRASNPRLNGVAAGSGHAPAATPSTTAKEAVPASKGVDDAFGPVSKSTSSYSISHGLNTAQSDSLGLAAGTTAKRLLGTPQALAIPRNRLVHAVAALEVRVKSRSDLSAKTNRASQIVSSLGGYAQSVRYQNSRNGYAESVLELRVPVQKANAALGKLSALGTVESQQVATQDLQQKLTHENSGIGSLQRAIAVYESALNSGTLSGSQRVIIEVRLNNARRQLSQLRHARTGTLASGATASISLLLTTHNQAIVAHHHHKQGRLGRLLGSAARFLGLEGIIVLYALIVLSPIVLIGALAWWIVRERRRREERLLASV
jgi:Domain of unknown function (DUF4349)